MRITCYSHQRTVLNNDFSSKWNMWNLEMAFIQKLKLWHLNDTHSSMVFLPCEIWSNRLYLTRLSKELMSEHLRLSTTKQYIISLSLFSTNCIHFCKVMMESACDNCCFYICFRNWHFINIKALFPYVEKLNHHLIFFIERWE